MKQYYLVIIIFAFISFNSCDSWLDVRSEEEILEEDAFKTGKGYRTALIGVYRLVGNEKLWGKELTWGFASVIGRNYKIRSLPRAYSEIIKNSNYENPYTKLIIKDIWEAGYNVIANCNNILKNIEKASINKFEYPWERDMIIAEARGLRALMHFELMRYFVPAPITGYKGKAIPYVRDYPVPYPPFNTTDEVLNYIIEDLKFAQKKLKSIDVDIILADCIMDYISTYLYYGIQNLKEDGTYGGGAGFFSYRGCRMNYWSSTALLARVYSYKRENETAIKYINELFDKWIGNSNFEWGWYEYDSNPNKINGKRLPEAFLCFRNKHVYKIYNDFASSRNYMKMTGLNDLFQEDKYDDYRYRSLYDELKQTYRVWIEPTDPAFDFNNYTTRSIISNFGPLLPIIELPELYYIQCEYFIEKGDINKAINTLKQLKDARGIKSPIEIKDYNTFMQVLINDATRDFLTRGQTWHYLKKLNWPTMYNGTNVAWEVPKEYYVLPIPENETNFH